MRLTQVKGQKMRQITSNVYCEDQFSVPPSCRGSTWSYVTTSEGIVMIDTPMVPRTAIEWREKLAVMAEIRYVINTHHHVDHITGNFFLPGTVVSHEGIRQLILGPVTSISGSELIESIVKSGQGTLGYVRLLVGGHDPDSLPLLDNYELRAPTITFTDKLTLYVGNHTFHLFHMPGHTETHIGVYVPQEKVFFAGDNFTYRTQPSLVNSLPLEWVESLRQIEALDVDFVVPGHGEVADKKAVQRFRLFIEQCIDMVREAIKKGMTREEAAESISFENIHPGESLPVHPGKERQRRNVRRLYDMLSQRK